MSDLVSVEDSVVVGRYKDLHSRFQVDGVSTTKQKEQAVELDGVITIGMRLYTLRDLDEDNSKFTAQFRLFYEWIVDTAGLADITVRQLTPSQLTRLLQQRGLGEAPVCSR